MTYENVLFVVREGIARLTLNRPDRLNAFNQKMHDEVRDALAQLTSSDARVLLLTGSGRGFCAGQDLGERARGEGDPPLDLGDAIERNYKPLVQLLTALPVPIVCAVNGVAAGAGSSIALACDLVIAKRSARFIQSFVNVGLVADAGATWMLPRLLGQARALGLMMTGEAIDAETAMNWGLIWRSVVDEQFDAEVEKLVAKLAAAPTRALAAAKQAVRGVQAVALLEQMNLERDLQRSLGLSEDYAEGVAAFHAKRVPRFTGR
jgi:2-(1,2-epoxy-1,2-dihydrophenyl)acetyl-CoA isomerase